MLGLGFLNKGKLVSYLIAFIPVFLYYHSQYLSECDEVILMRDGQIAEHGTHAQLMGRGRDYASLFNSMQQEVRHRVPDTAVWEKAPEPPPHNNTITSYITA